MAFPWRSIVRALAGTALVSVGAGAVAAPDLLRVSGPLRKGSDEPAVWFSLDMPRAGQTVRVDMAMATTTVHGSYMLIGQRQVYDCASGRMAIAAISLVTDLERVTDREISTALESLDAPGALYAEQPAKWLRSPASFTAGKGAAALKQACASREASGRSTEVFVAAASTSLHTLDLMSVRKPASDQRVFWTNVMPTTPWSIRPTDTPTAIARTIKQVLSVPRGSLRTLVAVDCAARTIAVQAALESNAAGDVIRQERYDGSGQSAPEPIAPQTINAMRAALVCDL